MRPGRNCAIAVAEVATRINAKAAASGPATEPTGTPRSAGSAGDDIISFEQYRDWRLNYIDRRRSELAVELAASDLPAGRKTRLEQIKAYYEWFAGLPDTDRDRRFRERFDRIDANHDGQIDGAERAAWHDKQRVFYRRDRAALKPAADAPMQ